ncbi:MAG: D-glycerate dehydrogenase [Candidatus Terrybacteria bacterium]|nr:D-glycerate dehydrogenase [Candidatus Terrybacteria bacterium]
MKIYVTRKIPQKGIDKLVAKGHEVDVSQKDGVLTREEFLAALKQKPYDAVLCLLTDKIDKEVFEVVPTAKIFANYAVGFDNINLNDAKEKGVMITNTPGVLTETVAEHTFALMLAIAHRISEADRFTKAGKFQGWGPMMLLGNDVSHKTLGIIGLGRIGSRVAYHAVKGFDMKVLYYDVKRDENFEKEYGAEFKSVEEVLRGSDFVSIHVPLLPETRHLINTERLKMMKPSAYLINTSRGPIVDEATLVEALKNKTIKGAALDVFENEPALAPGLTELDNVILTPHIASATEETRSKMSEMAAENIIAALEGKTPPNIVKIN